MQPRTGSKPGFATKGLPAGLDAEAAQAALDETVTSVSPAGPLLPSGLFPWARQGSFLVGSVRPVVRESGRRGCGNVPPSFTLWAPLTRETSARIPAFVRIRSWLVVLEISASGLALG